MNKRALIIYFFLLVLAPPICDAVAACNPGIKIVGNTYSPTSLQDAYDYASQTLPSFTLLLSGEVFDEDLFFDKEVAVELDGGYDCSFTTKDSTTGILGTLIISAGSVEFAGDGAIVTTDRCDFDADLDSYIRYTGIGPCNGSDGDCNDNDINIYPGADEICDGIDNNCDGQIDEGSIPTDNDGDGYYAIGSCGDSLYTDDCNDDNSSIHPGALDIPFDEIDQDCNGEDLTFAGEICANCHGSSGGGLFGGPEFWAGHHDAVTSPDTSCASCHAALVSNILPGHYGRTVLTAGNGMATSMVIDCKSCHDPNDKFHSWGTNTVWSKVQAVTPNITCDTCHENRAVVHENTDLAHDNRTITTACGTCHTSGRGSLANDADVDALHRLDCNLCHNYTGSTVNAAIVRKAIQQGVSGTQVSCNGCHYQKINHHGGGSSGNGCVQCHGHDAGTLFDPDSSSPYNAGNIASQGQGTVQSHSTHTELDSDDARGPGLYCDACHNINNFPNFKDGLDLENTTVCDPCHSSGGAFDGINDPTYGVKDNWRYGIYNSDGSLRVGKDFWCISCHDDVPANSKENGSGVAAPDKAGDNSSFGYYATGHGVTTSYNATLHGRNGPGYRCTVCHDSTLPHISHNLGDASRLANIPDDGLVYTSRSSEICLDCHQVGQTSVGSLGYDSDAEASIHSGAVSGNYNSSAATAFPAYGDSADYSAQPGYQCEACHEVHGTSKLAMVLETIDGQIGGTSNPVNIVGFEASDNDLRDLDPSAASSDGVCDACHSAGGDPHPDTNHPGNHNQGNTDRSCIQCHPHSSSFAHGIGGSSSNCGECHGHDAGFEYSPGEYSAGNGSAQSHSTHTERDADDIRGPVLACNTCHAINNFPNFISGVDVDEDGKISLAETDVCAPCHSPDGPFDGVDHTAIGAKNIWDTGAYTSTNSSILMTDKEKWCVGCHDSGTSLIGGRQAPDVAGSNDIFGYYQSGHGAFFIECDECHGLAMDHNFDNQKTYDIAATDRSVSYKQGFRLSDVDDGDPIEIIPSAQIEDCYSKSNYALCLSCHNDQKLLQVTVASNGCDIPYGGAAAVTTGFRDESRTPTTNTHSYHLLDKFVNGAYDSDGDGTLDSMTSCTTCHNPHGPSRTDHITPTVRMTTRELGITTGSDGTGDYGMGPNPSHPCAVCHGSATEYYRDAPPESNPTRPATPVNGSPADGTTGLTQPLIVGASDFFDTDGSDTHKASQWQFSSASGSEFVSQLTYDSGAVAATTTHTPAISWTPGATYSWRVRYQDNHGIWSEYSASTSFTLSNDAMPNQPVNLAPARGAVNVDRRVVLEAESFSDAEDAGPNPQNSIWQVSTSDGAGFWGGMVYNSESVPGSTSHVVPVQLNANQRYYWRTSSQDSAGNWSIHSQTTSFTTSSLITKFEFEEGSGSIVFDSEEGNDGTLVGGATRTTGFSGRGLDFDGTTGEITWSYENEAPRDSFTMEAMIKATTTHQIDPEAATGSAGNSGQKYVFYPIDTGTYDPTGTGVSVGTNGVSVYEYSAPVAIYDPSAKFPVQPQLGTDWHHVVVTYTETRPRVYLDGRLVHVGLDSSRTSVFAPVQLGHGTFGGFTGTVDEVAIYNKALTQSEVLQRCMELGLCGSEDTDSDGVTDSEDNCPVEFNPDQADHNNNGIGNVCGYLGYWKLDEGSGYIAADESGRNHALIGGWEQWTTGVSGGNAFAGNGSFNGVEVENLLDNHSGDFSLSVWLKFPPGTTNPKWSVAKGDPWSNVGIGIAHWVDTDTDIPPGLFLNDGTPNAEHRVSLYASSIPRDTWGHFVWTIDRANHVMKVYKNGHPVTDINGEPIEADISILGTNAVTSDGVFDFATPSNQFFGALDNVGVYDFVLQPGDVQARFETDLRNLNASPVPYSFTLADNNNSDPAAAEAGFTNNQSVAITVNYSGAVPTEMEFAEDLSFSVNATGWVPFSSASVYNLSAGDETKTVYGRFKTANGEVSPLRATIILDTTAPTISNTALTRPNGSEIWIQGNSEDITWSPAEINDDHLKDTPLALAYSRDGGSSFPNPMAVEEANDGSYLWSVAVENSTLVQVQLAATDKAGNQGYDSSDNNFSITPVTPGLDSVSVSDNNSADPAEAEDGYTNSQSVTVSLSARNFPTEMKFAEDSGFSVNATPWVPYSPSYSYNLTTGDGSKTVFVKVKNEAPGESNVLSDTIVLDTVDPTIQNDTLTSPDGHDINRWQAEFLVKGGDHTITWDSGDISDVNLKANPIFLRYSIDSGGTWAATLAGNEVTNVGEANNTSYLWTVDADYTHYARIQLAARDKAGNEATDISNHDFNISPHPEQIVTNTNDSGSGSLRNALTLLGSAGGGSPIWFNIPDNDPNFTNGTALIQTATTYPTIQNDTLLDGTSQKILRGDTNPKGPEIRVHYTGSSNSVDGFTVAGNSSGIRDLQITRFSKLVHVSGTDFALEGCQLGFYSDSGGYGASVLPVTAALRTTGASTVVSNNYMACGSGMSSFGSTNLLVQDNVFGLFPDNTECQVSGAVSLTGVANARVLNNIINSHSTGVSTSGYNNGTTGLTIRGNQIGAAYLDGNWVDFVGPMYGVRIDAEYGYNILVGGPSVASSSTELNHSNVIAADPVDANPAIGIYVIDVKDRTTETQAVDIYGNFIGTDPEKTEVFAGNFGIKIADPYLYGMDGIIVGGGGEKQAGNVIANMSQYGIAFEGTGAGAEKHVFSQNSFYDNGNNSGDDAIYLSSLGNNAIERPVIASLSSDSLVVHDVYGGYNEETGDIIEVFIADFDGTEFGEGKEFIASGQVSGAATSITVDLSGVNSGTGIQQGDWITITKTNVFNGTSAFSANVKLTGPNAPALSWTGEPNYTVDGIDPDSAAQNSDFTFRVVYTDADNDSPWPIEVWIDVDNDDTYGVDEKFAMTEVDKDDADYTDGKLYTFSKTLPYVGDGIRKYRFFASDAALTATGAATGDQTFEVINAPPVTPSNVAPLNAALDVMQPPILVASGYINTAVDELAGDNHQASQWLIGSVSGDFSAPNLLYDSGTFIASNTHDASFSWAPGTTYYWKVRYQDNHGEWSEYSSETGFTTFNNTMPDQPTNLTPVTGAVDVPLQPTLTVSSPYFDTDGDAHQASTWQVSLAGGARFDSAVVYNSITGPATSHTVTSALSKNNKYYWRVRHQDSANQWSAWSSPTEFFVPTSLISMFPFDNDSGVIIEDVYGNNNGSVLNGALWATGFSGQGLTFDGTDDHVLWSYAGGRPVNNFTIEAMVKATTTHEIDTEANQGSAVGTGGQKYLFAASYIEAPDAGTGVSMGTNGISVYEHSGSYMPPVAVYDPASKDPAQPLLGTGWNHVVISYADKQSLIYLNGQLVHTGLTSLRTNVFAPTTMGSMGYGAFAGTVDEVAIYNSALTQTEVMQHCIAVGQCPSADLDEDGVTDSSDNCMFDYNPAQNDQDNDGVGNACDYLALWKFDEGTGTIAQDDSVHDNDGQLFGGATWTAGKVDSAVDFDGTTGYISIPDSPIQQFGTGSFTIETWINASSFTSTDDPNIVRWFSKSAWCPSWSTDPSCKWFVGQIDSSGHPEFRGRGYNDTSSFGHTAPGTISLNTWHHIAYVIDRSGTPAKGFIYIDGVNQSGAGADLSQLNGELDISASIQLGGPHADLTGKLDQTVIYDSALTTEEILDHYQIP